VAGRWKKKHHRCAQAEVCLDGLAVQNRLHCIAIENLRRSKKDDIRSLREALRILTPKARSFVLMRLHGRSFEEIASSHGYPIRTVETSVCRSMKILRRSLTPSS
jgi:DNA-directed RNA polymerase specialized sigma24 family protein